MTRPTLMAALSVTLVTAGQCSGPHNPSTSQQVGTKGKVQMQAAQEKQPRPEYRDVLIKGVPHVRQRPDFCGEACTEMALKKLGKKGNQNDVFNLTGVRPTEGRGAYTPELARALKRIGFKVGQVWYRIAVSGGKKGKIETQLKAQFAALHKDLLNGIPSIVCMHYDDRKGTTEHFRLILGYSASTDEVIYHEPAEKAGAYRKMKRTLFLKLWPLKYRAKKWTVIRLRLEPGRIKQPKRTSGFAPADFAQHIMKLKKILPRGFTMVIEPPFVVVGDESAAMVRQRAVGTVKWATDRLKALYFKKDPKKILDVWLFKNKASYVKHVKKIFNETPSTPFGYYSEKHGALIMNIATGGGTLVHEIVHPFVEANFPDCPAWLNEGLGSLYEQCGQKNNRIWGYTNWRLKGLQRAIRAKTVPSFKTLLSTSSYDFYEKDKGTNYGQSRYLCYYLQHRGLLARFYHAFRKNRAHDKTGYKTLKKVLGVTDMEAFQKQWEAFVLKLRFPPSY